MKRSWIGLGLLLALLVSSAAVTWGMEKIHEPVTHRLWAAENAAQAGDWPQAVHQAEAARESWQKWRTFRSCFADHSPMEEIEGKFAQLMACVAMDDREALPGLAAETAEMVKAMGDAHGLTLGNFF